MPQIRMVPGNHRKVQLIYAIQCKEKQIQERNMQEQCKRGFTSDEQEIEEASLGYEQRRDCKGEELGGGGSGSPSDLRQKRNPKGPRTLESPLLNVEFI